MSQTSYSDTFVKAFEGMKVDLFNDDVESMVSEEASAEIPFGHMVVQGTADDQALLPSGASDVLVGVVLHSHAYAKDDDLGTTGLKPKTHLNVLRRGRVWVRVEEACSPGDTPHVRYAGAGDLGAFRVSAVGGETIDASAYGVFRTSAGANELALLELDMANG